MDFYAQMGQVYALLIENREIYSKPLHRRVRSGEREAATLLQDIDFFQAIQEFVSPQGFELRSFSDFDMPGIANEGHCFLLVRRPDADPPSFGADAMMEKMALTPGESKEVRAVWFLHLWAWMNYLLYTAVQRGVGEVARYTDSALTDHDLVELTREHVEQLRQEGPPVDAGAKRVWEILVAPKHKLQRRVSYFLQAMTAGRFLYQPNGEEIYRQSLLGALEMNDLFERGTATLIPEGEGQKLFIEIVDLATQDTLDHSEGAIDGAY
jgi:hypothetical protein